MLGETDNLLRWTASRNVFENARDSALRHLDDAGFIGLYNYSFLGLGQTSSHSRAYRLGVVPEGRDEGRVALYTKNREGIWVRVPKIGAAEYLGLIGPDESLAAAVRRISGEGYPASPDAR